MVKTPPYLSLSEAAEAVGKSKSVIHKALNNGTISHSGKDESGYKIDPSELFRVFPKNDNQNTKKERSGTHENSMENIFKIKELEIKLEFESKEKTFYKEQFQKAEKDRDDWKQQAQTLLLQSPSNTTVSPTQKPFIDRKLAVLSVACAIGLMGWLFWPQIQNRLNQQTAESLSNLNTAAGQGTTPLNYTPAPTGGINGQ